ncbi:MAG: nucleotidyltransferase family protein [Proteobacteria bacterium]|nr:nucleotidyltransferase family protein [Candidatus Fonsibacter sp. PEL5]
MIERAIVLAAGFGKRVLPLTNITPKPLLKINNVSLLENTLNFLKKFGVTNFAINTHHLGDQIISFAENNKNKYDIKIFTEKNILGTGGGIRNALDFFQDKPFISINSDTIWSDQYLLPLKNLYNNFTKHNANSGLLMIKKENSFDKTLKGDFTIKSEPFLFRQPGDANNLIFTGCQIVNPILLKNKKNENFSIQPVWDEAIADKKMVGEVVQNIFYHVTDLQIYEKLKQLDLIH